MQSVFAGSNTFYSYAKKRHIYLPLLYKYSTMESPGELNPTQIKNKKPDKSPALSKIKLRI